MCVSLTSQLKNMVAALYASQEGKTKNSAMKVWGLGGAPFKRCLGGRLTVPGLVCLGEFQDFGSLMCTETYELV